MTVKIGRAQERQSRFKSMATKKKGQETDTTAKQANAKLTQGEAGKNPAPKAPGDSDAKGVKEKGGGHEEKPEAPKEKKRGEGSGIVGALKGLRTFLKEVAIEFSKISWPVRAQVVQETYSVLFLVTIITLMVLAFDWFLGHGIFGPLEHWAHLHGGGVGRK